MGVEEVRCPVVSPRGRAGPRQGWLSGGAFLESTGPVLLPPPERVTWLAEQHGLGLSTNAQAGLKEVVSTKPAF